MTPTQLYRHFDASGRLLYVGISNDARQRLQQHLKCCDWRARFSSMTVEEHPTRGSAVDAEARAILEEHPIYNRAGRRKQYPVTFDDAAEMAKLEAMMAGPPNKKAPRSA